MIKVRQQITLPNGNPAMVWYVYQYGYIAQDTITNHMEIVYTSESPIPPEIKHVHTPRLSDFEVCDWLNENSSDNVIAITGTMGGFTIFYKEETNESKTKRLGEQLESIFD